MKLSIVMPVYNEESTITDIVEQVTNSLKSLSDLISEYEIIIVNDCSTDSSKIVIQELLKTNTSISFFDQEVNLGKGAAISLGFKNTSGDIVLVQDADLEYDPTEYRNLILPIVNNKADVVYGSRFKGDVTRVLYYWHSIGNKVLTTLSNMFTNLNLSDMETCYKVFRGDLIRNMRLSSQRFGIEPEMTAKISKVHTLRIYEIPISYFGRTYEEGKKIGWKDGVSAIWSIIKFNLFTSLEESFNSLPIKSDLLNAKNS